MNSCPMYFPTVFELNDAVFLNQLVVTAYDMYSQWVAQKKPKADAFNWQPKGLNLTYSQPIWGKDKGFFGIFKETEPFAFIAIREDKTIYLVFRGTESTLDWAENIKIDQVDYPLASGYGKVHQGFLNIYESMSSTIRTYLAEISEPSKLYITGHSLGSSLSTLSVPDIITNAPYPASLPVLHYNLASPRTGDPHFATAYNANGVVTYRVVNTCDIVPTVPLAATMSKRPLPLYEHVGVPVNFTAQYGSIVTNHSAAGSYLYALQHPEQPQGSE